MAILQTEGLSKRYRIGSPSPVGAFRYRTLREALVEAAGYVPRAAGRGLR
jgi:hypothetical protein